RLRDRRFQHALGSELFVQSTRALHRSAERSNVLTDEEHAGIAAHLERDRLDHRFHVRETTAACRCPHRSINAHANTSSTPSSASVTSAAALACSTAAAIALTARPLI